MTQAELEQLSRDVAEKLGIYPAIDCDNVSYGDISQNLFWLHDDSARCFDLMVEHAIEVRYTNHIAVAYYYLNNCVQVPFKSYTSKQQATCVAILKALLAKDKP